MSRIFLSHSSRDNLEAIALRNWLASEGWNDVFLDLDPERGIAAGERWERALHAAANRCEAVIFLVSQNWIDSGWCLKEYALARGLNKKLFAALTDRTKTIESLPAELTGVWQIVNLVHGQDLRLFPTTAPGSYDEVHIGYSQAGLTRLKRGLEKAGLDPRFFPWPPKIEPDRAPYRGLKPQEAPDAGIFFGRDAPIVEAIDRLRGLRAGAPPRLLAILGASGAGKSSFLRAGLLPRLRREDVQFIPLPAVRPERAALTGESGFVNALAAVLPTHSRADLRMTAQSSARALRPMLTELVNAAMAQRIAGDETERRPAIVIAIDQAEELFRAEGREESEALLALLADLAVGDDPSVIVIFAIRSDSYDALQNAKALEGLRQVVLPLLPMPRGAYQEVIEGPARRVQEAGRKLEIESALTQRLLVDVEAGAGDALPLLAFTLEQLYLDYRQTGALRLADYERFGGLRGAIDAAVDRALVRADSDARIPPDRSARLALLRRGLIPWLAGIDPDSKTPRRNIARRDDIPPEAAPLIDLLVEERLLSADTRATRDTESGEETRDSTLEPTHEALLRQWGLLQSWLTEDFGLLTTLEGARRAAHDWDANGRGDSWLAHQGQRLADAQALDARPDIAAKLDATDRAYLATCGAREETLRTEAAQRRREREDEQARRLADARKIARRTRIGLFAALALATVAVLFATGALYEKSVAEKTTELAKHAEEKAKEQTALTKQAEQHLATNIDLAVNDINIVKQMTGPLSSRLSNIADLVTDDLKKSSSGDDSYAMSEAKLHLEFADFYLHGFDLGLAEKEITRANDIIKQSNYTANRDNDISKIRTRMYELLGDVKSKDNRNFKLAHDAYFDAISENKKLHNIADSIIGRRLLRKDADLYILSDDLSQANRSLDLAEEGLKENLENSQSEAEVARLFHSRAEVSIREHNLDRAEEYFRKSDAIYEKAVKTVPYENSLVLNFAHMLTRYGDFARQYKKPTALESYNSALRLYSNVLADDPTSQPALVGFVRVRQGLRRLGSLPEAEAVATKLKLDIETNVANAFGSGIGNFHFGVGPEEINKLFRTPFADVSHLPRDTPDGAEFEGANYFWKYLRDEPELTLPEYTPPCVFNSSFVIFLFLEGQLSSIGYNTPPGDCGDRKEVVDKLASRLGITPTGTSDDRRFVYYGENVGIMGKSTSYSTAIDFFQR
jgi:hypothetical protein